LQKPFKRKNMNLLIIAGVIGPQELIVVLVVVVLMFGGTKIPELMKGLGKGIKEFKAASKSDEDEPKKDAEKIEK
jgi:sec-independent protein translocase protein TatA